MRLAIPGFSTSDSADHAEDVSVDRNGEGRRSLHGDSLDRMFEVRRLRRPERRGDVPDDSIDRAFSDHSAIGEIDAAHGSLCREIKPPGAIEYRVALGTEFFGEDNDRAAFWRRIESGREVSRLHQRFCARSRQRNELGRLPIAHGNRAGLIEQQSVHVACRFHGLAGHGEHIEAERAIDASDADG